MADLAPLLEASWDRVGAAGGAGRWLLAVRLWLERQLVPHDEWVTLGWCGYRADRFDLAAAAFTEARSRVRHSDDASVGLGFVALRRDAPGEGVMHFASALDRVPKYRDAFEGLVIALERLADGDPAARIAHAALQEAALSGTDRDRVLYATALADRKAGGRGELRRHAAAHEGELAFNARAGADYLEVRGADGNFSPMFVKGVNLSAARPGFFPNEGPEDVQTWQDWLARIAGLGANAVRVYTLQPPAFYRALAAHNEDRPTEHLWLLQGVWAELPRGHDFRDGDYVRELQEEISRVVDAAHGDLVLAPHKGHAGGVFDADVSDHVLAWIVGREWEPFAVMDFERHQPRLCSYGGRFVMVERGRPMECWIAETLDFTAAYEAGRHGEIRPLTFANWPTLDPLTHTTEASRDEENGIRSLRAGAPLRTYTTPAWDDDSVTVDATVMSATSAFPPGVFASYHIYPNFPYFMNLEPAFAEARDDQGILRYAGYLRALKSHHGRQPVLVAEFGMSTSRGIAHLQPEGLHHGGHDETEAMRQNARLLLAIEGERMAGGVAFEFMDEWFKVTWSTSPFEVPADHRPRWFNAESPEQSYGLFANRPRAPVRVDGDPSDWAAVRPLAVREPSGNGWSELLSLRATRDAGWLYVLIETAGRGPIDWQRTSVTLGLDTYAPERGERRLPPPASCATDTGVEFAVRLSGPDSSELLVTEPYLWRHPAVADGFGPMASPTVPTGRYASLSLETNRERYTRDGRRIAPQRTEPGKVRFGSLDPDAPGFDTLTDVALGPEHGVIELRLPWALLGFADPSSRQVLHIERRTTAPVTIESEGLRLYACASDQRSPDRYASLPSPDETPALLVWDAWSAPAYVLEPKHGLDILRAAFQSIPALPPGRLASREGDRP